jgi:mono/diheme cytochrome c family protein
MSSAPGRATDGAGALIRITMAALAAAGLTLSGSSPGASTPGASTPGASMPAVSPSDTHADGRVVYTKWCAPCHDPGVIHPGTNALTVKYRGVKPGVLLEWMDLQPETVRYVVRHGISVMPQFRKTEISDAELDALAKFLSRNTPAN